jgi:hypothetical protein
VHEKCGVSKLHVLIFETLCLQNVLRWGETKTQIFENRHVEFRKQMRGFSKINVRGASRDRDMDNVTLDWMIIWENGLRWGRS